ncbi:MAG: DUF4347 domain-containing protein, partial [Magnetococcales bacterium]|nr:DUF4347 domain-containing protein [Magnetococcales bacterium]
MSTLIFVDSSLANFQSLVHSLPADQEVILLNPGQDGLAQMAAALSGRSGLAAIHLFSHGSPGTLQLGSVTLNSANLADYSGALATIGASLSAGGDLLLYGCDVAAGDEGRAFINALAQATGADVAASDDLTGAARLGGDWQLEVQTGAVQARDIAAQLSGYDGVLDVASLQSLPIDLAHWNAWSAGTVQLTANGLQFSGTGYRNGNGIDFNSGYYFDAGTDLYIRWQADGGYMGMGGTSTGASYTYGPLTTGWSFGGSVLIPHNTWIYTKLHFTNNRSYTYTTSTGNYNDAGGTVFTSGTATNNVALNRIGFGFGDNYNGTGASITIGEVKTNALPIQTVPRVSYQFSDGIVPQAFSGSETMQVVNQTLLINPSDTAQTLSLSVAGYNWINFSYSTDYVGTGRDIALPYSFKIFLDGSQVYHGYSLSTTGPQDWHQASFYIQPGSKNMSIAIQGSGGQMWLDNVTLSNTAIFGLDLAAADDTGTSNSDNITNQTSALTISGSGGEVGSTLVLFDDKDNDGVIDTGEALATTSVTATTWNADVSLANGTHAIKAIQTDAAGNSGAASVGLGVTVVAQPTNNAPTVTAFSKAGDEDAAISFATTNFSAKFSDPDSDALARVKITSLPSNGTLRLSGAAVTLNQEIVAANLGNLSYVPNSNWSGNDSFGWNGYDGTAYASSAATVTLAVNPVNDAPMVTGFSKSGRSDTPVSFVASDFSSKFSDVDGDNLNRIRITSLPSNGSLQLNSAAVTLNQEVTAANLGNLAFVPTAGFGGSTGFQWLAFDGQEWSGSAATVGLTITAIATNNAPTVTAFSKAGDEDAAITFATTNFSAKFNDPDSDVLARVKITSLPSNGTLRLSGAAVTLNQEIVAANLGNLSYVPNSNWSGNDSFGWNGYDGTVYASSAATVTLAVNPVNDAPMVSGFSKSGRSDATVAFTGSDFTSKFSDADGDSLNRIRITSLPSNGSLQLNSAA